MSEPEKVEEAPKTEVMEATTSAADAKPAPPEGVAKPTKSAEVKAKKRHVAGAKKSHVAGAKKPHVAKTKKPRVAKAKNSAAAKGDELDVAEAAVSATAETEGSAKTGPEESGAKKKGKKSPPKEKKVPKMPEKLKYKLILRVGRRKAEVKRKVAERLKYLRMKKICIEHARKHLVEYKRAAKREISLMRSAQKAGNFYVPAEPKLAFVVRIRGVNGIHPKPRKTLQLMRLLQINNGVFVRLNKATLNMLRLIDPYIAWGYPSLRTVRRLIYKRGFCKVRGQRLPLSNEHIQRRLGRLGIVCVEDLVHEIYTVGPNFKPASSFLWRFKLNNPTGGFRKKGRHFVEGGDFGNRENYINKLLKTMI
eukprot:TsM_000702400 transcript=TsM_000702400 gene=TsM_000702400